MGTELLVCVPQDENGVTFLIRISTLSLVFCLCQTLGMLIYHLSIYLSIYLVVLRPIEVGARGFVARSVSRLLRELGFSSREVTTLCRSLATVVARCSFTIYLASSSAEWHVRDLFQ